MIKRIRRALVANNAEPDSDSPFEAVPHNARRDSGALLVFAFGWEFLITGLLAGGVIGAGLPFWPQLVVATSIGNMVNFIIGALIGYIGYQSGCNSGLLYRFTYGRLGAAFPILFLAALTLGWQAIIIGAFSFAFVQDFNHPTFYGVAVLGGALFTMTTYFGIKGLELVSLPAIPVLVGVGLTAVYINIKKSGQHRRFPGNRPARRRLDAYLDGAGNQSSHRRLDRWRHRHGRIHPFRQESLGRDRHSVRCADVLAMVSTGHWCARRRYVRHR